MPKRLLTGFFSVVRFAYSRTGTLHMQDDQPVRAVCLTKGDSDVTDFGAKERGNRSVLGTSTPSAFSSGRPPGVATGRQ